jgi:hypothetical protein
MTTLEIDGFDWFDSDSCSELTDDEAQTIQGGSLPNYGGSVTRTPPQPQRPPVISRVPRPTIPIGPPLGLPPGRPTFP